MSSRGKMAWNVDLRLGLGKDRMKNSKDSLLGWNWHKICTLYRAVHVYRVSLSKLL
jgi:uncharacterized protein (UPF0548 family)